MKILQICWTTFGNKITYWKKWPSRLRVDTLISIYQVPLSLMEVSQTSLEVRTYMMMSCYGNTFLITHPLWGMMKMNVKWKHFPCYWHFVQGIHWSLVSFPHKGQKHGALMFSFICIWTNSWANNWEAGDLRGHLAHFDVTVMGHCAVTLKPCLQLYI